MPRRYQRKRNTSNRAAWTEQQLQEAINKVKSGEISKREAHRRYLVPPRTLEEWEEEMAGFAYTATSGFEVTGLYDPDWTAIPDHVYSVLNSANTAGPSFSSTNLPRFVTPETNAVSAPSSSTFGNPSAIVEPIESTSTSKGPPKVVSKLTPTKYLHDVSPNTKAKKAYDNKDCCVECFETYEKNTKKVDWLQCLKCLKWLHETCTMYGKVCNICSREEVRNNNTNTA
ncbi:hypothetical protein ILUMI_04593 [Ignelater luminosus]|uniref:Uncharacterized protein n=1 Tax=Ignelater luminosus TaxID=2038154 RepID=A0A8K0DE10_IGNLU|nr:hypothetical protein ILUMI_04593 [Ignelater luminosus]